MHDRCDRDCSGASPPDSRLLVDRLLDQKLPQVVGQIFRRHVPFRRTFGQCLETDPFQFLRNALVHLPQWTRLVVRHLFHQVGLRFPAERLASHQQLVEHHSQTENVRSAVDAMTFAAGLLRTHVSGSPGVPCSLADILLPQCQPEIRDERLAALVEQEIPGLDVPMHQALLVSVVQCLGHGRHQFDRLGDRQSSLLES